MILRGKSSHQAQLTRTIALIVAMTLALAAPAVTAQTCRDAVPATRPDSRFITDRDGTVRDLNTGLMWKRCVEGASGMGCERGKPRLLTWKSAMQQGRRVVFAGYADWRLPDQTELASLVEARCYGIELDAVSFPNTPAERFWTSTPAPYYENSAWMLHFGHSAISFGTESDVGFVRLVRDRAACSPASPQFCVIR
ncbi:DUF1566 domain-containing protein [Chromatium okenii]|jgi:hypothetical protein|uniref:Lcl C-terminal domain-containing protein n=1 Tax=Chromatium okenii TaxID=61644 RepID=UPI0026E950E2|nr:DUF1566 domain-containing protein [Chromatium okenii]